MDYESERHRGRFKAWAENHPAEPSIDAIVSEMFIEIERLKAENEKLASAECTFCESSLAEVKKLREALEEIKNINQDVFRSVGSISPSQKRIWDIAEEALKDSS